MAETIKLPGIGEVKKTYVVAGVAVAGGMVAYAWWKAGTAPQGDLPAYSEEDVTDAITDTPGGDAGPPANSGGASHDSSTTPDTDAEWGRMAVDMLEGSYERDAIQTAIGLFLTAQPLNRDQELIVRAAIGVLGYPPEKDYRIITGTGATPSALQEPKNVRVEGTSQSSIRVNWDPVTGAHGYRIYRVGVGQNVGDSKDTTAVVGGLRANTSYTFYVRAMDADFKTGPESAKVTGKTEHRKLSAPGGVSVKADPNGVVWVSWSPVEGAESYRVYHNRSAQNVGVSRDTRARIGGLKQKTTYKFHVRAVAGGTTGPASASKSVKTRS